MAVQGVRFYPTRTLLEVDQNIVRAMTTNVHRLAFCETQANTNNQAQIQAIIPKKTVVEIQRLSSQDEAVEYIDGIYDSDELEIVFNSQYLFFVVRSFLSFTKQLGTYVATLFSKY